MISRRAVGLDETKFKWLKAHHCNKIFWFAGLPILEITQPILSNWLLGEHSCTYKNTNGSKFINMINSFSLIFYNATLSFLQKEVEFYLVNSYRYTPLMTSKKFFDPFSFQKYKIYLKKNEHSIKTDGYDWFPLRVSKKIYFLSSVFLFHMYFESISKLLEQVWRKDERERTLH